MVQIAGAYFTQTAKDKPATVDADKATTKTRLIKPIENVKSKGDAITLSKVEKSLQSTFGSKQQLLNKAARTTRAFDSKDMTAKERLESFGSGLSTGVNQLGSNKQTKMLNEIGGLAGSGKVGIKVGDVVTDLDRADLSSVKGASQILTSVSGNSTFMKAIDLGTEQVAIRSALNEAAKWNVPSMMDTIIDQLDGNASIKPALKKELPNAVHSSNLHLVKKIIDVLGVGVCLDVMPNMLMEVTASYRYPNDDPVDYQDQYNRVVDILNRLALQWETTTFEATVDVHNQPLPETQDVVWQEMSLYVEGSKEFKALMANFGTEDQQTCALAAMNFNTVPASQYANAVWPTLGDTIG